jgi:hypothetical protein
MRGDAGNEIIIISISVVVADFEEGELQTQEQPKVFGEFKSIDYIEFYLFPYQCEASPSRPELSSVHTSRSVIPTNICAHLNAYHIGHLSYGWNWMQRFKKKKKKKKFMFNVGIYYFSYYSQPYEG